MENTEKRISTNPRRDQAMELVKNTNQSFFLTGKAGTGKTTFLKEIQKTVDKKFLVVAPTGIAALVAEGVTIHSFFRFDLNVLGPKDYGHLTGEKIEMVRGCDTIIIDEVSMVRCDIVDAIDRTLRSIMYTRRPFGGKQIIFSGDMYQLPPVLKNGVETEAMRAYYDTDMPFFFKADVFKEMHLPTIEFLEVYRQEDPLFCNVLNNIRSGVCLQEDMDILNSRCVSPDPSEMFITLTPRKNTAAKINEDKLDALEGELFKFKGQIEGKFGGTGKDGECNEDNLPAPLELCLKVGAQVMFTRNDVSNRWVNGTVAEVAALEENKVTVRIKGEEHVVEKATWESYQYEFDKEAKKLEKEVSGRYTQYPLRLAWAITIHKSQGLTFEKMMLDISNGTFASGQLYVALSRVKSLDGLYLAGSICARDLKRNDEVSKFASTYNNDSDIENNIAEGKAVYPFLRNGDSDGAAEEYLKIGCAYMERGDKRSASMAFKKMFNTVLCDSCLQGKCTLAVDGNGSGIVSFFNNAVLALYGNDPSKALFYVEKVLQIRKFYEAMYIKSRALFMLGEYQEADKVNVEMVDFLNPENGGSGYDNKMFYALAQVNEKIGDPCLDFYLEIIRKAPSYLRVHLDFHGAMHRMGKRLSVAEEEQLPELCVAFNATGDAGQWEETLTRAMNEDGESFEKYLDCLKKQYLS